MVKHTVTGQIWPLLLTNLNCRAFSTRLFRLMSVFCDGKTKQTNLAEHTPLDVTYVTFVAQQKEKEKFEEEVRETQDNLEKRKSLIRGEVNSQYSLTNLYFSLFCDIVLY